MNLRPYLQLVRLPNVFTALADIALAALATGAWRTNPAGVLLLALASVGLYWGGMVFNDVFDVEQDRRERPHRPIPSGRVSRRTAIGLGIVLLLLGMLLAGVAGTTFDEGYRTTPVVVALFLVGTILAYDGGLKQTWAGPLAMGSCRFLNVLLGLTAAGELNSSWGPHLAFVVGLYIVGVTWFARTEARVSNRTALAGAALVMLASLLLALPLPARMPATTSSFLFPYLLVALGFLVGIPVSRALNGPTPAHVQAAVKRSLQGLVLFDAVLATGVVGLAGLAILLLLVPILLLSRWRWLYAT